MVSRIVRLLRRLVAGPTIRARHNCPFNLPDVGDRLLADIGISREAPFGARASARPIIRAGGHFHA